MENKISQRFTQLFNSNKLPWIIIGIGILLRLIRYLHNPSFWSDESLYATDIINRSFLDLFNPSPDFEGGQFWGFFILTKSAVQLFGTSEYAFRLFPLLFGITSLFLFYRIAKYFISPGVIPIALGLFAVTDHLVFHSSVNKSYSSDVFFALLIYNFAIYIQTRRPSISRIALFSILGSITLVFSAPSVFILAGVGATLILSAVIKKEWQLFRYYVLSSTVWVLSFTAYYFLYIRSMEANISSGIAQMLKWEDAYMPFPPLSLADFKWFIDLFFEIFNDPSGMTLTGIAALSFIIGCVAMYSEKEERFFLLISPVLFTLLSAILHRYPFKGRLILFLVPAILLFVAEGIEDIWNKTRSASAVPGIIIVGLLLFHPITLAAYHALRPFSYSAIKPVLSHIKDKWQEGDIIYVHFYAQHEFEYYSKYLPKPYTFDEDEYVIGIASRGWYNRWKKRDVSKYYDPDAVITQSDTEVFLEYIKEIHKLKGRKRVWILFTQNVPRNGIPEEKFFLFQLDLIGKRLDSFGKSGVSSVYLYDLSE